MPIHELLSRTARRVPDKMALVCGERRLTYAELATLARRLAAALGDRGVRRGDRVLVLADGTTDAVVALWGVLLAGAVIVPVSAQTPRDKLLWLRDHAAAAATIAQGVLTTSRGELALTLGDGDGAAPVALAEDELAAILYTSGSTGRPRGVMMTHHNVASAAASICTYLGLAEHDVVQVLSPLSFDYGLYQVLMSARQGARCVLAPSFALPGQVLKQTAAERVTFFPGVPTHFAMLAALGDVAAWDLSSVRAVTSTGAALTRAHLATIARCFPRAEVFSMYGLTECKRCTYLPPGELARKPGSVGIAIPGTELWLVDEQDRRLGPGPIGQLVVRGPHVMQGYWRDPDATATRLRPGPTPGERVLYTGDLCRLDEDGHLYFVGRTDDLIKSRGEKVAPKEVELALQAIAGVREAAVIGVPDALLGQALKAFLVVDDTVALTIADVQRACRAHLEPFMIPSQIVFVPALPRSDNGKLDRRALA